MVKDISGRLSDLISILFRSDFGTMVVFSRVSFPYFVQVDARFAQDGIGVASQSRAVAHAELVPTAENLRAVMEPTFVSQNDSCFARRDASILQKQDRVVVDTPAMMTSPSIATNLALTERSNIVAGRAVY